MSNEALAAIASTLIALGAVFFFAHPMLPQKPLQRFDSYANAHSVRDGHAVMHIRTPLGGAASVFFATVCIAATISLAAQDNTVTTTTVVDPTIQRQPSWLV